MLRISNMHGTGNSSTRTLNINRECESMSTQNIDVTDSPDSANTILKNLRLANVNRLICAQLNINSIRNKFESLKEIARKCPVDGTKNLIFQFSFQIQFS